MFKKGNNIFSLLVIVLSVFMTSSVNIVNAADSSGGNVGTEQTGIKASDAISSNGNTSEASQSDKNQTAINKSDTDPTTTYTDWGNKFVTKVQLLDANGNVKNEFGQYDDMLAYWEFSTGSTQIHASPDNKNGDTLTVDVPKEISLKNGATDKPIYETGTGKQIGTGTLDKSTRTITVKFNSYAANKSKTSPITGSFQVTVNWDINEVTEEKNIPLDWTTQGTSSKNPGTTSSVTVKPSIPDPGEILYKYGGLIDNFIQWTVRVNYKGETIKDAIYKDTLGKNQTLISYDSADYAKHPIKIESATSDHKTGKVTVDSNNDFADKKLEPTTSNGSTTPTGFTVNLGTTSKTALITYYTKINNYDDLSGSYSNTGDLLSNKTELMNVPVNIATNQFNSNADTGDDITSVMGQKIWNVPAGTKIPDTIKVNLIQNGNEATPYATQDVTKDNGWYYIFNNLPEYDASGNKYKYKVSEAPTKGSIFTSSTNEYNYDITNTLTPDKTKFTVTKVWNDGKEQNDHAPIIVGMYDGDGKRPTNYQKNESLSAENNWSFTYKDLNPDTIWYVSEYNIPSDYISTDSYNYGNNHDKVVTNTLKTTLKVTKAWDDNDNKDKVRPKNVQVQLYANDNSHGEKALGNPVELNSDNKWSYEFGVNHTTDP